MYSSHSYHQNGVQCGSQRRDDVMFRCYPGSYFEHGKKPEIERNRNDNFYANLNLFIDPSLNKQNSLSPEDVFEDYSRSATCSVPEIDFAGSELSRSCNADSDESLSELDFTSSTQAHVPFQPKRCSTPKVSVSPLNKADEGLVSEPRGRMLPKESEVIYPFNKEANGVITVSPSTIGQHLPNRIPQVVPVGSNSPFPTSYYGYSNGGYSTVPELDMSLNSIGSYGAPSIRPPQLMDSMSSMARLDNMNVPDFGRGHCPYNVAGELTGTQLLNRRSYGVHHIEKPFGLDRYRGSPMLTQSVDSHYRTEQRCYQDPIQSRLAASLRSDCLSWSGILPARNSRGSAFSCKVFLGGVPWDITETDLHGAFRHFGNMKVEWPVNHSDASNRNSKGYLYIIFDDEGAVRRLLDKCIKDFSNGTRNYYYKVSSERLRRKDVQVIPWQLADSSYVRNNIASSGTMTVFVGSLHGMLNAEGLARVMDELFGNVVSATIDTDKYKYPIGSGRVVFNDTHSYLQAIKSAFVELRTPKFSKKIQIDPFLEDSMCSMCQASMGPFFCRDMHCFAYYCGTCWQRRHAWDERRSHTPMMRNSRVHENEF